MNYARVKIKATQHLAKWNKRRSGRIILSSFVSWHLRRDGLMQVMETNRNSSAPLPPRSLRSTANLIDKLSKSSPFVIVCTFAICSIMLIHVLHVHTYQFGVVGRSISASPSRSLDLEMMEPARCTKCLERGKERSSSIQMKTFTFSPLLWSESFLDPISLTLAEDEEAKVKWTGLRSEQCSWKTWLHNSLNLNDSTWECVVWWTSTTFNCNCMHTAPFFPFSACPTPLSLVVLTNDQTACLDVPSRTKLSLQTGFASVLSLLSQLFSENNSTHKMKVILILLVSFNPSLLSLRWLGRWSCVHQIEMDWLKGNIGSSENQLNIMMDGLPSSMAALSFTLPCCSTNNQPFHTQTMYTDSQGLSFIFYEIKRKSFISTFTQSQLVLTLDPCPPSPQK